MFPSEKSNRVYGSAYHCHSLRHIIHPIRRIRPRFHNDRRPSRQRKLFDFVLDSCIRQTGLLHGLHVARINVRVLSREMLLLHHDCAVEIDQEFHEFILS